MDYWSILIPHYSSTVTALKRAHTIRIDNELWPSTIPTTPDIEHAKEIENALTRLTERALKAELAVLFSRNGTVVLTTVTPRGRAKITNRIFKTIDHRKLRRILVEHFGRQNFSMPASAFGGRKL